MSEKVLLVAEVDEYLRETAGTVFSRNRMPMSTAINLFLNQVVDIQETSYFSMLEIDAFTNILRDEEDEMYDFWDKKYRGELI